MHKRLGLWLVWLLLAMPPMGCSRATLHSEHPYLLLLQQEHLVLVLDDDPLQTQFSELLQEPYFQSLLTLYDKTAQGILADGLPTHYQSTFSSKLPIILGNLEPGVKRAISFQAGTTTTKAELALSLGGGPDIDLATVRSNLPSAVGELLLFAVGLEPPEATVSQSPPPVQSLTTPNQALWTGFCAALDAHYGALYPEEWPSIPSAPGDLDRLYRYREIPRNGLRTTLDQGQFTSTPRTYDEALRTPGVVGTFFFRLWRETSLNYPQRDMLWFANYDSSEVRPAKILLALNRMSRHPAPTLETFVASYGETFPAENDQIIGLLHDTVGIPDFD